MHRVYARMIWAHTYSSTALHWKQQTAQLHAHAAPPPEPSESAIQPPAQLLLPPAAPWPGSLGFPALPVMHRDSRFRLPAGLQQQPGQCTLATLSQKLKIPFHTCTKWHHETLPSKLALILAQVLTTCRGTGQAWKANIEEVEGCKCLIFMVDMQH